MSTVRTYLVKSCQLALVVGGALLVLVIAISGLLFVVPNDAATGVMIVGGTHRTLVIGVVVLLIIAYLGYRASGVFKKAEKPYQELAKMAPALVLWCLIVVFAGSAWNEVTDGTDCQAHNYNEQLNGGRTVIGGKAYIINLCGSGRSDSFLFGSSFDRVRLEVLNEQGELMIKRYYSVFWDGQSGHEPIAVHQDSISYVDDAYDGNPQTITIPPTYLDWLRARVALFN
jgi:hypothetical protein